MAGDDDLKRWALRVTGSILRREVADFARAAEGHNPGELERNTVELASAMTSALVDAFKQGQRMPIKGRGRLSA